ncbi:MAG: YdeI/OmpD-associated family protein, partial [Prevotellaceae bacterium]|nr:YdeI/OmpD-associated family protein [Prevotellaceae bacterium]
KSCKISPEVLAELKKDNETYNNFLAFPELYIRVRIDTIQQGHLELFKSRLKKFVENTKQNKLYGDWNDSGRLLNY